MSIEPFWKYEACGNDFVLLLDLDGHLEVSPERAAALCDRRTGIGADGVIRVAPAAEGFLMDYRNADGSPAGTCGNGIRCLARLAHDRGLAGTDGFAVVTPAGISRVTVSPSVDGEVVVTAGMGSPAFARAAVPMSGPPGETFLAQPFELDGRTVVASALSMGNPHLVLFVEEDPAEIDVERLGPALEHLPLFPQGANVEFARAAGGGLEARVWERGSGETLSCGSGACAVSVAAQEMGVAPARTWVRFPGGRLDVERGADGSVSLSGPVDAVFEGTIDLDLGTGRRA